MAATLLSSALFPTWTHAAPRVEDSIAQRALACVGCHGPQTRATQEGYYPRIAGKPAGYLYHQLLNFREGRRHYTLMSRLVDPLSDAYLLELATYFSQLELPYPPHAAVPPSAAAQRGEALVMKGDPKRQIPACVQCHGASMTGVAPDIPGLLGLPRDYLNAQLGAWRTGSRRAQSPDCMAHIARQLTLQEVSDLSAWLSSQPVPSASHPASNLPEPLPTPCGGVTLGARP
jgi:cytochrome c553